MSGARKPTAWRVLVGQAQYGGAGPSSSQLRRIGHLRRSAGQVVATRDRLQLVSLRSAMSGQSMQRTRTLVKKSRFLNEWHSSRRCVVAAGPLDGCRGQCPYRAAELTGRQSSAWRSGDPAPIMTRVFEGPRQISWRKRPAALPEKNKS